MKKRSDQKILAIAFTLCVLILGVYAADVMSFYQGRSDMMNLINSPFEETISFHKVVVLIVEILNYTLEG